MYGMPTNSEIYEAERKKTTQFDIMAEVIITNMYQSDPFSSTSP